MLETSLFFSPGSLHEGDEIAEINGKSVVNQTVDQLQKILVSCNLPASIVSLLLRLYGYCMWLTWCLLYMQKETNGVVTMKIIPNPPSRSKTCEVKRCRISTWSCASFYFCSDWNFTWILLICMTEPRKFTVLLWWSAQRHLLSCFPWCISFLLIRGLSC